MVQISLLTPLKAVKPPLGPKPWVQVTRADVIESFIQSQLSQSYKIRRFRFAWSSFKLNICGFLETLSITHFMNTFVSIVFRQKKTVKTKRHRTVHFLIKWKFWNILRERENRLNKFSPVELFKRRAGIENSIVGPNFLFLLMENRK